MQSCYRECVPSKKEDHELKHRPQNLCAPTQCIYQIRPGDASELPPSDQRRANMLVKYDTKQENQVARED